jgi:hypothetical protein
MAKAPEPTDPEREAELGRVALWLDPDDLRFRAAEWRRLPDDAPEAARETWGRIAFRSMAALHKAGQPQEAEPSEDGGDDPATP